MEVDHEIAAICQRYAAKYYQTAIEARIWAVFFSRNSETPNAFKAYSDQSAHFAFLAEKHAEIARRHMGLEG